jgi:hypothetical protein
MRLHSAPLARQIRFGDYFLQGFAVGDELCRLASHQQQRGKEIQKSKEIHGRSGTTALHQLVKPFV